MGDVDAVEEVQQAWAALNNVDLLDVTPARYTDLGASRDHLQRAYLTR